MLKGSAASHSPGVDCPSTDDLHLQPWPVTEVLLKDALAFGTALHTPTASWDGCPVPSLLQDKVCKSPQPFSVCV